MYKMSTVAAKHDKESIDPESNSLPSLDYGLSKQCDELPQLLTLSITSGNSRQNYSIKQTFQLVRKKCDQSIFVR
jgi:hypothetical protein